MSLLLVLFYFLYNFHFLLIKKIYNKNVQYLSFFLYTSFCLILMLHKINQPQLLLQFLLLPKLFLSVFFIIFLFSNLVHGHLLCCFLCCYYYCSSCLLFSICNSLLFLMTFFSFVVFFSSCSV